MVNMAAEMVLWTSLALVAYGYVGYPLLIWGCARLFGRRRRRPAAADGELPSVTLLIAAHNEERWIGQRLENALAQDYPPDKLDLVVASDCSRDGTVAIAAAFAGRGVRVLDFRENRGKATALNAGIREARHPLVVFSDANTFFEPGAIRRLAGWFADPAIGTVTIGDGARVGANAVVVHDVPAGATVVGIPARVVRRRGVDDTAAEEGHVQAGVRNGEHGG